MCLVLAFLCQKGSKEGVFWCLLNIIIIIGRFFCFSLIRRKADHLASLLISLVIAPISSPSIVNTWYSYKLSNLSVMALMISSFVPLPLKLI